MVAFNIYYEATQAKIHTYIHLHAKKKKKRERERCRTYMEIMTQLAKDYHPNGLLSYGDKTKPFYLHHHFQQHYSLDECTFTASYIYAL